MIQEQLNAVNSAELIFAEVCWNCFHRGFEIAVYDISEFRFRMTRPCENISPMFIHDNGNVRINVGFIESKSELGKIIVVSNCDLWNADK